MKTISLGILAIFVASAVHAAEPTKAKAEAADGKTTFAAKCASCHGKDGKGSASMAKMFKVDAAKLDLTAGKAAEADLLAVIREGRGKMPKFEGKLDAAAIKTVAGYAFSLRPADKPAK